ncbi:hypothetical protein WDU94_011340, partial [Cyamophila willieti]
KRNQLYPDEYKYPKPSDTESIVSKPEAYTVDGEKEKIEIMWDRREPVEIDPHEKLDFVLDEFLVELSTEYGVAEEYLEPEDIEEENEENHEQVEND